MSGVKFGNARKAWSFFPDMKVKQPQGKAAPPAPLKMSKNTCLSLIAIIDIAGQRMLKRVVDNGEVPLDPITTFANEIQSLMRDYTRSPKSFKIVSDHTGDHVLVDCSLKQPDGQSIMASSVLLDLNDATAMISTGLCCLARVYGREAIASFVGPSHLHLFPSPTDLIAIASEVDDPYDIFADFGQVLLFDDANLDPKNKDWVFDAYTDDVEPEIDPKEKAPVYRPDRD